MNGDGIHTWPNDAGDMVHVQLDHPEVEFVLGGGSLQSNGGAADCNAVLYAYGNNNQNDTIRELASVGFHAAG